MARRRRDRDWPGPLEGRHIIRERRQLAALRTPLRNRIMSALGVRGEASVRELADELGREPESLYYHLRALVSAGLVRRSGRRPTARRPEALYEPVAREVVIDPRARGRTFLEAVGQLYGAMLRDAERHLGRALAAESRLSPDEPRSSGVVNYEPRLSEEDFRELQHRLLDVMDFVRERDDPSAPRRYSLTMAVAPVETGDETARRS